MDALMPALVAVALTEVGGKVQKGVRDFSLKGGMGGVFAALIMSSLVYYSVAVIAGSTIANTINARATLLFFALSLAFAGIPMMLWAKAKLPKGSGFGGGLAYFANIQFGDASAFILLAIAVRSETPLLALIGGMFGIAIAAAAPLLLGPNWPSDKILTLTRRCIGLGLTLLAAMMALRALRII